MKYAPLIHSRTYHCDFNAKFSVRPDDFTDEDYNMVLDVIYKDMKDE